MLKHAAPKGVRCFCLSLLVRPPRCILGVSNRFRGAFAGNGHQFRMAVALLFGLVTLMATPAAAETKLLTAEDLRKIAPKAKDEFIQAFIGAESEFEAAGINTRLRMAHFLAQVMTETGGLRRIDENMNYSYKTLMRVFSRKTVSETDARRIAGKPKEVANWVYGARLGNRGRDTDDGWNYRGSGFIQLTGRYNFEKRGADIGLPLAENPELAREARAGLTAAIAYWEATGINAAADANDRIRVRKLVNGPAAHGADQARVFFNTAWTKVFAGKEAAGFESGTETAADPGSVDEAFDDILKGGGFIPDGFSSTESGSENTRADALRDFQETWGLPETGVLDEATQDALLDPRMWRLKMLEDEGEMAALDVAPAGQGGDPEATVKFSFGAGTEAGTGMESASVPMIEAKPGTGQIADNVNLKQEDLAALSEAGAIYPEYEMGEAAAKPETFVPFSVIGADDRRAVLDTTGFPARAIVQIRFENHSGGQSLCSGSMISPDTVLTAAHCIHSGTKTGRPFSNFRFFPGRNVGAAPFGECNARDAFVLGGWTSADTALDARTYDLGAFKLDCEIGNATGQLAVRSITEADLGVGTIVHGYAADKAPQGRQWVSEDKLRVLQDLKGFYDNDTFGGTSGSAVFAAGATDTIIGIHTNGLHGEEPWASHNAFTRITDERLSSIQSWIAQ